MLNITSKYRENSFECIFCNSLTQHNWELFSINEINSNQSNYSILDNSHKNLEVSTCHRCNNSMIWLDGAIIYPITSNIPYPNEDMPEKIKSLYSEARDVYPVSKRSSAALLRLALQELCIDLGGSGENIFYDISRLIDEGLDPVVKKSLEIIGFLESYSIHPGKININENPKQVEVLFFLLNFIADEKYTKIRKINEFYKKCLKACE